MKNMMLAVAAALGLSACGQPALDLASLAQSRWQLVQPALTSPRGPLWFEIDADKRQIYGFSGCNRFTGGLGEGDSPQIGPLAQTRMACADGMESEQQLMALLADVAQFNVQGDQLTLTNGQGTSSTWQAVAKGGSQP